ncbi:endonuclease MutS2 [Methanolobus sp. ZRKC3]|uniref:MutS-related protein n=1 Tax=Methanolobus sp. ZRKC3 TaxID=3125786 RepID=UPI003254C870
MSTEIRSLEDVPRIGGKMARRFVEHFGTEELALEAIVGGDIASISEVDGIGQRYAVSLVHDVRSRKDGVDVSDFLKTKEAMDVYEKLLDIIKTFAHTDYARDKLNIFFPYPSSKLEMIREMRESMSSYMDTAEVLEDEPSIIPLLQKVKQLNFKYNLPKVRDRVIITGDHETYEYSRSRFGNLLDVQLVRSLSEFIDIARGYSHVIVADDTYLSFEFPEDVSPEFFSDIEKVADWKIIPEKDIISFSKNLESIISAIEVVKLLRSKGIDFMGSVSDDDIDVLSSALAVIDEDGNIMQGTDEEVDRLNFIIENLAQYVSDEVKDANLKLDEYLKKSELTLNGQDMLKVMKGSVELKELLGRTLHSSYHSVVKECSDKLCTGLGLVRKESLLIDSFFPEEIAHPLEVNPEMVSSFRQYVIQQVSRNQVEHKREIARLLFSYLDTARNMVRSVLEFDVGFSIGCFARVYGLVMPELLDDTGLGFEDGRNLFLLSRHGAVVPINYSIGNNSFSPDDDSRVVLLSGVNSGGKTSMLELLAQSVILAHMGFPVPASTLQVSLTDGFYYFAKSKGTLDAGAFETTLKEFSIVADDSSKMVLVDELESITEPGASAKIIAGILEVLSENENSMAVFVSHLSELILESTDRDIRVDGIEASGLDADLNLVVDRSPRYNYIARSTPELIVERLSRKTDGAEQAFYDRLKSKF